MTTTTSLPAPPRTISSRQTILNTGCGLCGFLTVFGLAHLALIQITKPSGYVFFGVLALIPPLIALALARVAPSPRVAARRLAFGAGMCLLAIPCIYLARFFPASTQAMVRNLIGLPFLILALVGPGITRREAGRRITAEG